MSARNPALQNFLNAAEAAFRTNASGEASLDSISRSFSALEAPLHSRSLPAKRLDVCDQWLERALIPETLPNELRVLAEAFLAIEPMIHWRPRTGDTPNASANFAEGHANAMIVGPGGIEPRTDVWLGASLLAPRVRYPDHTHPPEETYLVMTSGEFSQDDGPWFAPGIGGSFYNRPGIRHAMRSGEAPLFAFWLLRTEEAG